MSDTGVQDASKCVDGVCALPSNATGSVSKDDTGSSLSELIKMGWGEEDAVRALNLTNNDVAEASNLLT